MEQAKYWAVVDSDGVCQNTVWSETGKANVEDNWIEYTPVDDFSIIGLQNQNGVWVDIQTYADKRKIKYDELNQFEMQFDDATNGTTTWVDAINAIKAEFPKV